MQFVSATFLRNQKPPSYSKYYSKYVTSSRAHVRGLAPGQHSSEETSQRWRAVDATVTNLTPLGIETRTSRANSDVSKQYANRSVALFWPHKKLSLQGETRRYHRIYSDVLVLKTNRGRSPLVILHIHRLLQT